MRVIILVELHKNYVCKNIFFNANSKIYLKYATVVKHS